MNFISDSKIEQSLYDFFHRLENSLGDKMPKQVLVVSNPILKLIRFCQMSNVNFFELVDDIINNEALFDTHFNEWETCPLCITNPFVIKLEHISEDLKYLLSRSNITHFEEAVFEVPPIDINDYLRKLSQDKKNEMFKVFRSHYELFGYNPYSDLLQK